jgi:hypothetical protein
MVSCSALASKTINTSSYTTNMAKKARGGGRGRGRRGGGEEGEEIC